MPMFWPPSVSMATTRRFRCWPRARPTRAAFGPMCATTDLSAGRTAGGGVLLLARSDRRHPGAISRISRDSASRRLCGVQRSTMPAVPGADHEAACWAHARRKFFVLADIAANAREAKEAPLVSPLALEAVRRIDAIFEIERAVNGLRRRRLAARRRGDRAAGPRPGAWMREERANSRAITIRQGRWTICSSVGPRSRASSRTAGFASRTTPPNERCGASPWGESHGCSPVPIAAASGRPPCTPLSSPPSSTMSIPRLGSPMCWPGLPIIRHRSGALLPWHWAADTGAS